MTEALDEPSGDTSDARRLTWLRRLVWVVLLAGVVAFLVEGADKPPDPFLVPDDTGAEAASGPVSSGGPEEQGPSLGGAADAAPTTTTTTTGSTGGATRTPTTGTSSRPATAATPAVGTPAPTAAPTMPAPGPPPPAPILASRRPLAGFDEIAFRITASGGGVTDGVAMLADDSASRSQGLMEQTDLRGYDAMVFRFPSPDNRGFYMRNTRIPLSIAFFDVSGRFVSSADMEPCPDEVEKCPTTFAEGPYVHAIEAAKGELPRLGIGPGSTLSFP
ncbi:MAG TPA: DUF192 domain-containing protein [Acidimicrobiales bacterium]|nr:DUF192 domain-containing protein [Acidimicrobiales bacterium]